MFWRMPLPSAWYNYARIVTFIVLLSVGWALLTCSLIASLSTGIAAYNLLVPIVSIKN